MERLHFYNIADFAKVQLSIVIIVEMEIIFRQDLEKNIKFGWKELTQNTSGIRMLRISR